MPVVGYANGTDAPSPEATELNLRDLLRLIRRRWKVALAIALGAFLFTAAIVLSHKPIYESSVTLVLDPFVSRQDATISSAVLDADYAHDWAVATQVEVLRSDSILNNALLRSRLTWDGAQLAKIDVTPIKETDVVRVSVDSRSHDSAARVANAIADAYIDQSLKTNQMQASTARRFTEASLNTEKQGLDAAEARLSRYKQKEHIASLPEEVRVRIDALADQRSKLDAARADLSAAIFQRAAIKDYLPFTSPTYQSQESRIPNPLIATLQSHEMDLRLQRSQLLKEYQPGAPEVRSIDAQILDAQALLRRQPEGSVVSGTEIEANPVHLGLLKMLAEASTDIVSDQARVQTLNSSILASNASLAALPERQRQMAELMRDVATLEQTYTDLASRNEGLRVTEAEKLPSARVLDRATPNYSPVRPRRRQDLVLAGLFALTLGLCAAVVLEHLDGSIKDADEVERVVGLPVLAVIPRFQRGEGPLFPQDSLGSLSAEAYRTLRTALRFAQPDAPARVLMIGSASPSEGKTTTAVNLAVALANGGQTVALVDLDLRRPGLARAFGIPGDGTGFTSVVVGDVDLLQAIRPTRYDGVVLLPSGPTPPDPPAFLGSSRTRGVIRQLAGLVDVLILDTPPCLLVSDAAVAASLADGVILVCEAGRAERASLLRTVETLRSITPRLLGVCLNKAPTERRGPYYYGYYDYGPRSPRSGLGSNGTPAKLNGTGP